MLCAAALRALEAATPVTQRVAPPSEPSLDESLASFVDSLGEDLLDVPSAPSPPSSSSSTIGVTRNAHSEGHTTALNAAEKWILAALRKLEKTVDDLVHYDHSPNDALASRVQETIAGWYTSHTTAADAGVVDHRPSELAKCPPQQCLVKARGWMIRHINLKRAEYGKRELPQDWGRTLAHGRAVTREVNGTTRRDKAAAGTLYHHKHDMAPSLEQLTAMTLCGLTADQCVHAGVLDALEAGMAIGLYLPTGARGSELKKMHLQSLGYEPIQDEKSGHVFECLKLTAFETKTKEHHLNQILPHSNPWRCGVGLLGLSVLVRVRLYGAPPFGMRTDGNSWKMMGTFVSTLDDRIKAVFRVAGVRRQLNDPVTYLGRHFGTRLLQHAGGSAEGGAARRGHSNGTASYSYTECPLPDMLRLAGNDPAKPFVPAHLSPSLQPAADAVVDRLFPALAAHEAALDARQREVDRLAAADAVRTAEQLNDQQRLARGLRLACRTAVACLAARPRSWRQWALEELEPTLWQHGAAVRSVATLFGGNAPAIEAMNALALQVRRCEEAEMDARRASPENAVTTAVVSALQKVQADAAKREARMMEQQQAMMQQLMAVVRPDVAVLPAATEVPAEETLAEETLAKEAPAFPQVTPPLASAKKKHARTAQEDVTPFSKWSSMADALEYARTELAPRERAEGAAWRILKRADGREDKSRDKQWRCYATLAAACATADVAAVQARFDALRGHTALLAALRAEQGANAARLARGVLGV